MVSRQGNSRRAREARSESVSSYIGKGIVTPGQGGGGQTTIDAFVFVGQSNMQGEGSRAGYAGSRMPTGFVSNPNFKIWNRTTHAPETYAPFSNSEGFTGSECYGGEAAFGLLYAAAFPGREFIALKRTQGNTGMAADASQQDWAKATGELYADVTTMVSEAKAHYAARGITLNVVMVFGRIGEQDAKDNAKAAAYATNFQTHVADSRIDWGYSRYCASMLHVEQLQSGFPYWSQVRAGQKSVADGDQNIELVITDGAGFVDQTLHLNCDALDKMGRDFFWVWSKGWTKFPWTGVGALADFANQRYVYPFVAGDLSTLKAGTRDNVFAVTALSTTQRGYTSSLGQYRADLAAGVSRLTWEGGRAQLVIEPTILNRALSSRDLTIAPWTLTGATAAKDQTGIDNNQNTATRITATAANATVLQAVTDATSKSRVFAARIKRITGSGEIAMMVDGVATPIAVTAGYSAFYVSLTASTSPTIGFRLATAGDEIAVDLVMLEDGTFATTPFNSSAASPASRNVEDIRFAATAFAQAAAATFVMKGPGVPNTAAQLLAGDSKRLLYRAASNTAVFSEGDASQTLQATAGSGGFSTGYGVAVSGGPSGRKLCMNGGVVASDTVALAARSASNPRLGMNIGGNPTTAIGKPLDLVAVFPTDALPDAQLQALATPHLAA